jgi:hypothetical protein
MDYKEACYRLRITPTLLKWFTRYSPKKDGRKLQENAVGNFDPTELDAFDAYLCTAWSTRYVPTGIEAELLIEACGHCGLCGDPCETLKMAHILRKDVEVAFYFQHPNNLIMLCGTCHDRYDDLKLHTVSLAVIQAAKGRLTSRKMEAIDRDVERARAVREAVESAKADLSAKLLALTGVAPSNLIMWTTGSASLLTAATVGVYGGPHVIPGINLNSPSESLAKLSGTVGPTGGVTQAVLGGYAQEAEGEAAAAPPEWDLIDYEDDRTVCDLCDPGEDRPPALVNYTHSDEGSSGSSRVDVGYCDWCNGISVRCRDCGVVRGVLEGEYGDVLECEGGCGLRFVVKSDYDPRDGGGGPYVEVVDDVDDDYSDVSDGD